MITRWREEFHDPTLWFGFVQIASFGYSHPFGNPPKPETDHSHAAGDLRQSQLAALKLKNVGASRHAMPRHATPCLPSHRNPRRPLRLLGSEMH